MRQVVVVPALVCAVVLAGCAGSRPHVYTVGPAGTAICPGSYPIKVAREGFTVAPWDARYADTYAYACYDSERNAAKAGVQVVVTNK